jgi:hypothetical protein
MNPTPPAAPRPGVYAQDPVQLDDVVAALAEHVSQDESLYWAALFDTAFDHGLAPHPAHEAAINCYEGVPDLDDLMPVAPCLVPLAATDEGREAFEILARHCSGRPMLSIVASRIPLHALVQRWAPLHAVRTRDGLPLLLRVADTRVLAQLPRLLPPAQWQAWAEPLKHWFFIDRAGALGACEPAPAGDVQAAQSSEFTDTQVSAFIDAMEADTLYARLAEQLPAEVPGALRPSLAFENIQRVCTFCAKHRVSDLADMCEIALRAIATQGRVLSDARLLEILIVRGWQPGRLGEALDAAL